MTSDNNFDATFFDVFGEVFGWQVEITDDDGPGSIEGWDSLTQIRLVHALELRFDVRLPDSALLERQSVASLKGLVRDATNA